MIADESQRQKILILTHISPRVLHERETSPLHVENGKRKNWRGKMATWSFLPFAVNVIPLKPLNIRITFYDKRDHVYRAFAARCFQFLSKIG